MIEKGRATAYEFLADRHHSLSRSLDQSLSVLGKKIAEAADGGQKRALVDPLNHSLPILVPLRYEATNKSKQNVLLCLPGAGASVTSFNELISKLKRPWQVIGLQPRGLDGVEVPHSTIEASAEACLRRLQVEKTTERLHLVCHSLGGWVGLHLAHRLLALGHKISSLTLIDVTPPDSRTVSLREYTRTEVFLEWIQMIEAYYNTDLRLDANTLYDRHPAEQLALLHERLLGISAVPKQSRPATLIGPLSAFGAGLRMTYIPPAPYDGEAHAVLVNLTLSGEQRSRSELLKHALEWRRSAPLMSCFNFHGNHINILRSPHVESVADLIDKHFD